MTGYTVALEARRQVRGQRRDAPPGAPCEQVRRHGEQEGGNEHDDEEDGHQGRVDGRERGARPHDPREGGDANGAGAEHARHAGGWRLGVRRGDVDQRHHGPDERSNRKHPVDEENGARMISNE